MHVPVVAVTTHQSTPAKAGGDPLPDRLQPFTEGSVEEPLATEPAGVDSTQEREPEVLPLVQRPQNKPTRFNNLFVGVPKDSNCAICEMTDRMRARCQKRLERRRDCIACPSHIRRSPPSGSQGFVRGH